MSDVQYYQGLAKSMMLAIILVSFTPLLIITLIAGYQYNVAYGERVDAHLRELVLKHDQAVDAYLEGKVEELRVLAEVVGVDQLRDEKSAANLLATLNRMHGPDFVDIGLVDGRGVQVAYAGPYELLGADYVEASWWK